MHTIVVEIFCTKFSIPSAILSEIFI